MYYVYSLKDNNPELRKVILGVRKSSVSIIPEYGIWFIAGYVNDYGSININPLASDEKIIAFLKN